MELLGKNILVVGAARSGISAAKFLASKGANVTLTDKNNSPELLTSTTQLESIGVKRDLGQHTEKYFLNADEIVISPGVPITIEPIQKALKAGVSVIGELELAARYLKGKIIAVTGSNGKTTTTTLIGKILADSGFKTYIGGNIGIPATDLIENSSEDSFIVLEVSSFQLETIKLFSPQVSVLLNITPDHLDRYDSFDHYVDAKLRLFSNATSKTLAVLNANSPYTDKAIKILNNRDARINLFSYTKQLDSGAFLQDDQIIFRHTSDEIILKREDIVIAGNHNIENVLAAVCVCLDCGVTAEQLRISIHNFSGVEHRLEYVTSINKVKFFNDSKATNVDAAIKAIESFPGNVLVIFGGKDKGSDYFPLVKPLNDRVKSVILLGDASEKIANAISRDLNKNIEITKCESMQKVIEVSFEKALPGDVVLLAPACASFDMFDNYEHRGNVFKNEVFALQQKIVST